MLQYLSIGAVLISADLSLADSDTCCLVDALCNLGFYFLLHDLLSQIGFFPLPSVLSKDSQISFRHVFAGVKAAGLEKIHVMLLLRIQHPYLRMSGCPGGGSSYDSLFAQACIYCCYRKIDISPSSP